MKVLWFTLYCIILSPFSALWHGFVGVTLWAWFVTPTYGIVVPAIWVFAGISLLVRLVTIQIPPMDENADSNYLAKAIYMTIWSFSLPAGTLLFGWIYHFWA